MGLVGDIVAANSAGVAAPCDTPALQPTQVHPARSNLDFQLLTAMCLARIVSNHYEIAPEFALGQLFHIPDNMLHLLDSPQGWTTIGEYIAIQAGKTDNSAFTPTIH